MERKYFEINETAARQAHDMMSMSTYQQGSTTAGYRQSVDEVYNLAEKVIEEKPDKADKICALAYRYSKKLADYYNRESQIGLMCPSVMISGPANFPVRKKEKQNAAWEKNHKEYQYIKGIRDRIQGILCGTDIIKAGDEDASERLEEKIESLEKSQEKMKAVNAYYRKNKTLDGCPGLTPDDIAEIRKCMEISWRSDPKPFESWALSNNNQNIRSTRERLETLRKAKEKGSSEVENDYFRVVENVEKMRLQILFDEKPDKEVREVLKRNGFIWAPSQNAWQRQLTPNAKSALARVKRGIEILKEVEV